MVKDKDERITPTQPQVMSLKPKSAVQFWANNWVAIKMGIKGASIHIPALNIPKRSKKSPLCPSGNNIMTTSDAQESVSHKESYITFQSRFIAQAYKNLVN